MADPQNTQQPSVDSYFRPDVETGTTAAPAPVAAAAKTSTALPSSDVEAAFRPDEPSSDGDNGSGNSGEDQGLLHGLYEHSIAPLVSGASAVKNIVTQPTWEGQRAATNKALLGVVQPNIDLAKRGASEIANTYRQRNSASNDDRGAGYIEGLTHLGEAAVPFLGPQTAASQDAINNGKTAEGIGNTMGDVLTVAAPDLADAAKDKIRGIPDQQAAAAHRGFTAVLDQGKAGMGRNFDAQEVANNIAPIVQQELQSNPTLRARILDPKATPKESYEAFQEAIGNAQSHIDEAHLDALKNVKNQPVDVKPILNEIDKLKTEGMSKYAPEDAAELDALKQRIASVDTLGELNGLRMYINNQTSPSFKMSGVAVQRSAMLDKAMNAAGSATRDAYYDGLSSATGQDFKTLKQTESNLLSAREALENAKGPLVSKEIQFNRPTTAKQKIGAVADAASSVVKGDKKKIAAAALNESPMAQTHADIRRFVNAGRGTDTFDGGVQNPDRPRLPDRTTPETINAQTTPNPRPRGPVDEVGGGATPGALPNGDVRSFIRRSAPFGGVVEDQTPQLNGSGGPPQQALPQGSSPRALPSTGSNSRVGVPGTPYPELNRSTAVDRTSRPIYPKPGTPVNGTVRVTPEGEAHIQREGLPAPEKKPKKPKNQ